MKTLTFEECVDHVASNEKYLGVTLSNLPIEKWFEFAKEAAELYRNQPSSLNKEEMNDGTNVILTDKDYDLRLELSTKQHELDELKEQLDEKIREAVRMAREWMPGNSMFGQEKYTEEEIINKLNPKS